MITKDDIATYRATYPREYWEQKAKEQNFHCVAPLGAVFAVNALCDSYEELECQRDELLAICKNVVERGIGASDVKAMKEALASMKGHQ